MWYHNLLIIFLYICLFHIFIASVDWYNQLIDIDILINPLSLNSKQLRALLSVRGVFDGDIFEKTSLVALVNESGGVKSTELKALSLNAAPKSKQGSVAENLEIVENGENDNSVQEFISGEHFYDQIEENKDSIWLIQIIANRGHAPFQPGLWTDLNKNLAKFGVRFGILYCSNNLILCHERNWNTSRLVLTVPQPSNELVPKNIAVYQYTGHANEQSLTAWIYEVVGARSGSINRFSNKTELATWLTSSCQLFDDVCMLLVSSLTLPPFFLAALSVRLNGRVKFGIGLWSEDDLHEQRNPDSTAVLDHVPQPDRRAQINNDDQKENTASSNVGRKNITVGQHRLQVAQYSISSGHSNRISYGSNRYEVLSFSHLQSYLKVLAPDLNDLFVFTLFFTNLLALMSIFDLASQAGPVKRLVHLLFTFFKYNLVLLVVWACLSGAANWQLTIKSFSKAASCSRFFLMRLGFPRRLILAFNYYTNGNDSFGTRMIFLTFLVFNYFIYCVRRRFWPSSLNDVRFASLSDWSSLFLAQRQSRRFVNSTNYTSGGEDGSPASSPGRWRILDIFPQRPTYLANVTIGPDDNRFTVLPPQLELLIEKLGIETVRAYPAVPYDYILGLETTVYCTEPTRQCKTCIRCKVVRLFKMKSLQRKLSEQPCSKCTSSPSEGVRSSSTLQNCPVCLDSYKQGDTLCNLPCRHSYHQRCIVAWLLRDQPSCPFCRYPAYLEADMDLNKEA